MSLGLIMQQKSYEGISKKWVDAWKKIELSLNLPLPHSCMIVFQSNSNLFFKLPLIQLFLEGEALLILCFSLLSWVDFLRSWNRLKFVPFPKVLVWE